MTDWAVFSQNLLDLVVVAVSLVSLGPQNFPASVIRSIRAFRVRRALLALQHGSGDADCLTIAGFVGCARVVG